MIYEPIKDYSANLVAKYLFNEISGTTCIDSAGKYNGTYSGTTSITENGDTFRRFNGTSDYVGFVNPVIPLGKKSIKFRIKTAQTTQGYILTTCNSSGTSGDNGCAVYIFNNLLYFIIREGSITNLNISTSSIINDNLWHNILFTWDGTTNINSVKLYVDDLIYPTNVVTANKIETLSPIYNLYIGRRYLNTSYLFQGDLDNIEIYNEVVEFTSKRFLIQNKTNNNIYTLDTSGNIILSQSQIIDESNYLTNGFDDIALINNTYSSKKVYGVKNSSTTNGQIFSVNIPNDMVNVNNINLE